MIDNTPVFNKLAYAGPGRYDFDFKLFSKEDLLVEYIDISGTPATLTEGLGNDYTVVINILPAIGGHIDTLSPANLDGSILIRSNILVVQEREWTVEGHLNLEKLENAFDEVVLMLRQLDYQIVLGAFIASWKEDWATGVEYGNLNFVNGPDDLWYVCVGAHTSGVWATDLAAGYWEILLDTTQLTGYYSAVEAWYNQVELWRNEVDAQHEAISNPTIGYYHNITVLNAECVALAAGLNLPAIVAGDAGKLLRVNPLESGYEHTGAIESLLSIDLSLDPTPTLDCQDYDQFYLHSANLGYSIDTINFNIGRTITVYIISPGAYAASFVFATTQYWENSEAIIPSATGVTVLTVSKIATDTVLISVGNNYGEDVI